MQFPEKIHYKASATWDKNTGGIINTGNYSTKFDTPIKYGGKGSSICPDQLFLASITGCLMNTFLNFKNRLEVETLDIVIKAEMDIEMQRNEGYRIKEIGLITKVAAPGEMLELNRKCAVLAFDYCHITQSIKNSINFTNRIEISKG
jgi:organic hydroperoxide reductase OsmC/OhrA